MRATILIASLVSATALVKDAFTQPSFLMILGDDIGWADFSFPNNGTARSPNLRAWANAPGSIYLQDFHTGGTVCSPTRATVLTGRNHFRDCVNYVYVGTITQQRQRHMILTINSARDPALPVKVRLLGHDRVRPRL